jgi:hypothetical protein
MRKQRSQHPGQIGEYWLSKKPDRGDVDDVWCRTWYDSRTRQTCRVSLGTSDFQAAQLQLAAWVIANQRPKNAGPDQVLIETVLLTYWNDHAQHLPSSKTQWLGLSYWQEFWTGKTVSELTPREQERFRKWLAKRGTGPSGIDRIMSVGRAALNRAHKWQELSEVPHIFGFLTAEEKRGREPIGRPVSPKEIARLMDAARSRHMLTFLIIGSNTLARPAAILDARPAQFDAEHDLFDLNPPGRKQNKKFRPIVPVTQTLRPWLERSVGKSDRYVSYRGKPIRSITHMWRLTREAAGLDERVTAYSIRHGMARQLRKRGVPTEQIKILLGHLPSGSDATTSIYAPYEPEFLKDAVAAIEDVMSEIRDHLKVARIDKPAIDPTELALQEHKPHPRSIGEEKRCLVRQLILTGHGHAAVVRLSGVSGGTVSKIRQDLKANVRLYRNTEVPVCVPFACRNEETVRATQTQAFEKIGGPGRTRTCDNTVMSGAF